MAALIIATSGEVGEIEERHHFGTFLVLKLDSSFTSVHYIACNLLYLSNNRLPKVFLGYILGFEAEENGDI